MKKNILFLEDNLGGIGSIVVNLRHLDVNCSITSDLSAWQAALTKYDKTGEKLDLLILDDNIYKETTLEKLGFPNIGTNGGSSTGSKLLCLIRSGEASALLKKFKGIPVIIYSIHTVEVVKSVIGELDNVDVFQKLQGEQHEKAMLNKCKELLGIL